MTLDVWQVVKDSMPTMFNAFLPVVALALGLALFYRVAPIGVRSIRRAASAVSIKVGGKSAGRAGSVPVARTRSGEGEGG